MYGKLGLFAVLGLALVLGSGCILGGLYSKQDYGPGSAVMGVTQNQSLADVIKAIGAPDKVFEAGNTKILVYTQYEGMQVMGLFGNVKKNEVVVLIQGDKVVQAPVLVAKGEALTVLGIIPAPVMGPTLNKDD